jgi:hypothetical protein
VAGGPWTDAVDLIVLGNSTEAQVRALREWRRVGTQLGDMIRRTVGPEGMRTIERGAEAIVNVLGETLTFKHMFEHIPEVPVALSEERDWYFQGMCTMMALLVSLANGTMGVGHSEGVDR